MTSKEVRLSLGWSQTELARRAGFPTTTIVDLENESRPRNPSFRVCMGVVKAYREAGMVGVQPEVLFADILELRAGQGKPPKPRRRPAAVPGTSVGRKDDSAA